MEKFGEINENTVVTVFLYSVYLIIANDNLMDCYFVSMLLKDHRRRHNCSNSFFGYARQDKKLFQELLFQ